MAPPRKKSSTASRISTSSILDVFRKSEEHQPETRLAIRTKEGDQTIRLPSFTRVLVIHNSDASAEPHHIELGEVTVLGPVKDFLKWYCYAVLTAAVCLGLAGLLLFFLFPRLVEIKSAKERLYPHYRDVVFHNTTNRSLERKNAVNLKYLLKFRVVNNNYIPITIEEVNCKVQALEAVHENYKNTSQVEIPLRSDVNLSADVSVFLSHNLGFMAKHCNDLRKLSHTIILNLDVTVRYRTLLGREGRIVLPTKQEVSCGPKGVIELPGGSPVKKEEWRLIMEGHEGDQDRKEGDGPEGDGQAIHQRESEIIAVDGESPEGRPPARSSGSGGGSGVGNNRGGVQGPPETGAAETGAAETAEAANENNREFKDERLSRFGSPEGRPTRGIISTTSGRRRPA